MESVTHGSGAEGNSSGKGFCKWHGKAWSNGSGIKPSGKIKGKLFEGSCYSCVEWDIPNTRARILRFGSSTSWRARARATGSLRMSWEWGRRAMTQSTITTGTSGASSGEPEIFSWRWIFAHQVKVHHQFQVPSERAKTD